MANEFSFGDVDPLELFERLVSYAYTVYGCFPDPHFEPSLAAHGEGPEDLAMEIITKFLDPDDKTVQWSPTLGKPTMASLMAYLTQVLRNDFLDRKRSKRFTTHALLPPTQSADGTGITLDELAVYLDTPEAIAARHERQEQLIAVFDDTPALRDVLRLQLDPDGYNAYTNIDMANLLNTTVSEIENRKKRIHRRLLQRYQHEGVSTTT